MIHINAKQTKMQFTKNGPITYRYVLRPVNYSRLAEKKVIAEASVRSGIAKGALKGAWDAIGEVLKAWLTEGHSVAIPGLGTLRFSVSGQSVEDVNDVAKELIKSRKVVYTPSTDIKDELKGTHISITCYDKDGKEVKRVQDDASDETISNRIKTYHEKTEPLAEFYKASGAYNEIDGTGTIEEVRKRINSLMDTL